MSSQTSNERDGFEPKNKFKCLRRKVKRRLQEKFPKAKVEKIHVRRQGSRTFPLDIDQTLPGTAFELSFYQHDMLPFLLEYFKVLCSEAIEGLQSTGKANYGSLTSAEDIFTEPFLAGSFFSSQPEQWPLRKLPNQTTAVFGI